MLIAENAERRERDLPFIPGMADPEAVARALERAGRHTAERAKPLLELVAAVSTDDELRSAAKVLETSPAESFTRWGQTPEVGLFASTAARVLTALAAGLPVEPSCRCRLGVPQEEVVAGLNDLARRAVLPWLLAAHGRASWYVRPPLAGRLDLFGLQCTLSGGLDGPGRVFISGTATEYLATFQPEGAAARPIEVQYWRPSPQPRWTDSDPLLCRATPFAVAVGDDAHRWRQLAARGWASLSEGAAGTAASTLPRLLVPLSQPPQLDAPLDAPRAARVRPESLSVEDALGVIFAGWVDEARLLGEVIVHEVAHQELFLIERQTGSLASGEALYSPWKPVARPARGVLHGVCSFLAIASFWREWAARGDLIAAIRYARALAQVELGLAELLNRGRPSPTGKRLLKRFQQRLAEMTNTPLPRSRYVRQAVAECIEHAAARGVEACGPFARQFQKAVIR